MNPAQLHLVLNHLPVIIPLIGVPILAIGVLVQSQDTQKVGLSLLILGALAAIPTYLTGEPAERLIKNYPDVSRLAITQHEKAAWLSLMAIAQLRRRISMPIWIAVLFLSLISSGLIVRTAHIGGQIRHEEIQTEEFSRVTR